jgi:RNA polymerase sigma-70 factor (ECF subfamily)
MSHSNSVINTDSVKLKRNAAGFTDGFFNNSSKFLTTGGAGVSLNGLRRGTGSMDPFDEIIHQYRQGIIDQDFFFKQFEETFAEKTRSFLRTLAHDQDQAEDIYQEVLLRVFRRLDGYALGTNFYAWLLRLARNQALNYLKGSTTREQARLEIPPDARAPGPGPKTENIRKETRALVLQALSGLKPEYREIIYLKFCADLTYQEISAITGMPISTLQERFQKGMNLLDAALQSFEAG